MSRDVLQDLPPALLRFVRERFPDDTAARRALTAPWPDLDFRSAWDERALWDGDRLSSRRTALERLITANADKFQSDQPFFPADGTGGTLRSPFTEMSDADYWLYVSLWGSEETARQRLERPLPALKGLTTLAFLNHSRNQGPASRLLARLSNRPDPRQEAWQAHVDMFASNYQ